MELNKLTPEEKEAILEAQKDQLLDNIIQSIGLQKSLKLVWWMFFNKKRSTLFYIMVVKEKLPPLKAYYMVQCPKEIMQYYTEKYSL